MAEQKHENPMSVRSKSALAQSLLKLMMTKPFDEISISEITAEAGLARQTFYTNFDRREDILTYLLGGLFERLRQMFAQNGTISGNFIIAYFIFWDKNREFLSLLYSRGLGYIFSDRNRWFFQSEFPLVCEKRQEPYIRTCLAGLTGELVRLWLTSGDGLSIEELSNVAENLLEGRIFAHTA